MTDSLSLPCGIRRRSMASLKSEYVSTVQALGGFISWPHHSQIATRRAYPGAATREDGASAFAWEQHSQLARSSLSLGTKRGHRGSAQSSRPHSSKSERAARSPRRARIGRTANRCATLVVAGLSLSRESAPSSEAQRKRGQAADQRPDARFGAPWAASIRYPRKATRCPAVVVFGEF